MQKNLASRKDDTQKIVLYLKSEEYASQKTYVLLLYFVYVLIGFVFVFLGVVKDVGCAIEKPTCLGTSKLLWVFISAPVGVLDRVNVVRRRCIPLRDVNVSYAVSAI